MGNGALLAPALSRHSSSHAPCPPKICFQACLYTLEDRCLFSSSLNLERVGSFLVYISVVLELVSVIQRCLLEPSLLLSLLLVLLCFFFKLLFY